MNEFVENNVIVDSEIMVSVICITYNHDEYISDALEGFVNQKTTFRYEVIVHDDASTDKTADIIREYQDKYPDIIRPIFQTENQYSKGVRIISSVMVPLAKGKYLAFCEGDDYWSDCNKLQTQYELLEGNREYVACVHNSDFLSVVSGQKRAFYANEDKILGIKDCVMHGGQSFQTSSVLVRKEIYCNAPDFVRLVKGVGDYSNAVYYSLCGPIYFIGKVMSVYRVGIEGSWSKRVQGNSEKHISTLENMIVMLKKADDYSNRKYHGLFLEAIEKHEYSISLVNHDYRKVVKSRRCFSKESLLWKIIYSVYALFPFLSRIDEAIKGRIKHE